MDKKARLFDEFPPSSAAEWKSQLMKDLKGQPFESLVWHNENGFDILPFYTHEDLKQAYTPAFENPYWEIGVKAGNGSEAEKNRRLLKQLNAGANAIVVEGGLNDHRALLSGIRLEYINAAFFLDVSEFPELKKALLPLLDDDRLNCSLFPLRVNNARELAGWWQTIAPFRGATLGRVIAIDVLEFHNQNCFAYYELAIALSKLTAWLNHAEANGGIPESAISIRMGVSSDYFTEMAKLRAMHRLWELFEKEYGSGNLLHIIAETSLTNKSVSGRHNNLLRTTVEAMAALAGGCYTLVVNEFDSFFPETSELAARIAINQQHILKEESYLDRMADVACGSYYVETLTDSLASRALETFKDFEKRGGYFSCLEKGVFKKDIEAQATQRAERLASGKQVVVGVNRYHDAGEKISFTKEQFAVLQKKGINNPVLDYEHEHYFPKG